jgi:hypothetical protein
VNPASVIDKKEIESMISSFLEVFGMRQLEKHKHSTERKDPMEVNMLQEAIVPLIRSLHQASLKRQVQEALSAMTDGASLHATKRLLGAADQLDHAHGREAKVSNFDPVVENWKRVQNLMERAEWGKIAQLIDKLPGMKLKVATFTDVSAHLIHLAAITNMMASKKRMAAATA